MEKEVILMKSWFVLNQILHGYYPEEKIPFHFHIKPMRLIFKPNYLSFSTLISGIDT